MRSTKPLMIALIAAALLSGAAITHAAAPAPATQRNRPGQSGPGERPMIFERMRDLLDELKLSPEQKTQIDKLVTKARDDMAAMRDDLQKMDPRDRMEHLRDMLSGLQSDITKQLNADQAKLFQQRVDEMRERFRNRMREENGLGATTRPGGARATTRPNGPGGAGGFPMIERLKENLDKLQLSDEQKTKVNQVLADLKTKASELRAQAQNAAGDVREKFRDMMQDTRTKLQNILTPEQQEKLRELMGSGQGGPGGGERGPGARGRNGSTTRPGPFHRGGEKVEGDMKPEAVAAAAGGKAVMRGDDSTMMSDDMKSDAKTRGRAPAARSDAPPTTMPAIGTLAPQFSIHKLDGSLLTLSSLKGRVVVLEFGSYSCPSFRRRVPAMEQMKHEYGTKAQFFVIYAKEAHPTGEWDVDRNKDEGISIEQPGSAEARRQIAQGARDKLKITVPVALDTMDNEVAKMYGAGANSAVVIDRDGRIAAHQEWFEPVALRKYIDTAAKATVSATRAAAAD